MDIDLGIEGLSELEQIGRGGSARVYKARQHDLDRWVAVKVLHSAWDEGVQRRFERERRAMGRLSDHPGIAPVFSTGKTKQGEPYIIMPFYSAGSLAERVDSSNPLDWREATTLMATVAQTLGDAHKEGIVHRDVKPANILMTPTGHAKVADFGISRLSSSETASQSTALSFTPAFAPPESFVTAKATPAVDVYGLAATLYALISGRAPFTGDDLPTDVLSVINRVAHEPVTDLRPAVPDAICGVIEHGMAKEPSDRPADGLAFLEILRAGIAAAEKGEPLATVVGAAEPPSESVTHHGLLPGSALANVPDDEAFSSAATVSHSPRIVRQPAAAAVAAGAPAPAAVGQVKRGPNRALIGVAAVIAIALLAGGALALSGRGGDSDGVEVAGLTQTNETVPTPETSPATTVPSTLAETTTTVELLEEEVDEDELDAEFLDQLSEATAAPTPPTTTRGQASQDGPTTSSIPPTTLAVPSILSVQLLELTHNSAVVQVKADACTSVTYSVRGLVKSLNTTSCSKTHRISVGGLSASTDYQAIFAVANGGGRSVAKSVSFETRPTPAPPTTAELDEQAAPVQGTESPVDTEDTTADTTADTTPEPEDASAPSITSLTVDSQTDTTARVRYSASECTGTTFSVSGITSRAWGYPDENNCVSNHQLLLGRSDFGGPLKPGTTYTVTVRVIDADGNRSAARSINVTTKAAVVEEVAPSISGFSKTATSQSTGTVSFQTDICAGSRFFLNGTLVHSDGYPDNTQCWNSHARTFRNLAPGTSYTVKVEALSRGGKKSSRTLTFSTDPAPAVETTAPPVEPEPETTEVTVPATTEPVAPDTTAVETTEAPPETPAPTDAPPVTQPVETSAPETEPPADPPVEDENPDG